MIKGLQLYIRVIQESNYMIDKKATVRSTAKEFNLSKSTVYRDLSSLLKDYSPQLYSRVEDVLKENKDLRHIRGGEATKRKYLQK